MPKRPVKSLLILSPRIIGLELPYPPSINHYWRRNPYKVGNFISKEGKKFRISVKVKCRSKRVIKLEGPLEIKIDVYPPDNRRRDIDNILKPLLDSLQHADVYDDDNQIWKLTIVRRDVVPKGLTRIDVFRFTVT